mmetsp:Transcript_17201/g.58143  ORF Transcript_17201/g.58143 Transcript_17201/m.58143 type:complete len:299 (+) Transcript_17201:2324-3220(+)
MLVARIFGVHRDGGVAEHGLQTRRGHDDLFARVRAGGIDDLIRKGSKSAKLVRWLVRMARHGAPRPAFELDVVHLEVGDGRFKRRGPVHQPVCPVDAAVFVQFRKRLRHRRRASRVHGEPLSRPVHRRTEAAELLVDARTVLFLPFPNFFQKLVAAKIVPGDGRLQLGKLLLHHGLRGDAGVVRARHVQSRISAHAVPPSQPVLNRGSQGVAQMQRPRHVGRRDDHGEASFFRDEGRRFGVAAVVARGLPVLLPRSLHRRRVVRLGHDLGKLLALAEHRRRRDGVGVLLHRRGRGSFI